jgi:hypothetical protein
MVAVPESAIFALASSVSNPMMVYLCVIGLIIGFSVIIFMMTLEDGSTNKRARRSYAEIFSLLCSFFMFSVCCIIPEVNKLHCPILDGIHFYFC